MTTKTCVRGLAMSALVIAVLGAARGVVAENVAAPKMATTADLGGADRYLTYVATDKPIYRAQEKVYVRGIVLNAATHMPMDKGQASAEIKILGPKGDVVATGNAQSTDSVLGFSWDVPEGAAGGEYTLKVEYPWQGYAPAERKFDVRAYRAPKLRSQVTFLRDGYGAGDKVTATLHTERAEGGIPEKAKVRVIARVDDMQVYSGPAVVDASGNCIAAFDLPKAMERGEGTLAFVIEDGGTVETASKTIPILLQTLDLNIYPEGGDAVAGVENRFYLEARTPSKKPADVVGTIVDSKGKKVAEVKTEHEGRGRFEFTPAKGETYTLTLSEPAGITKTWKLPQAKAEGVILRSEQDVVGKDQRVKLDVIGGPANAGYKITLRKREMDVAEPIEFKMRDWKDVGPHTPIEFNVKPETDGVLTVTVWDDKGIPLAERLVYKQPAHVVNVVVTPEQSTVTPGAKTGLHIVTTDENGKPISAMVGLTVTDDSVLEMVEKREQAPRLPAMVLLEPEVRVLADAAVYLDAANPKSALATDLLLGTQGWRRFALMDTTKFLEQYGDQARRVVANVKPVPPPQMAFGMAGGGMMRANAAADGVEVPRMMPLEKAAAPQPDNAPRNEMEPDMAQNAAKDLEKGGAGKEVMEAQMQQKLEDKDQLQQLQGDAPGAPMAKQAFGRRWGWNQGVNNLVMVREYAHALRADWSPTDRRDFAETLYWNAAIKTDEKGEGHAAFAMSDSVTTYRIVADGFSKTGAMGASNNTVQSVQPFFVDAKLPLEVTAGDVIQMPISVVNNTSDAMKNFNIQLTADAVSTEPPFDIRATGMPAQPVAGNAESLAAHERVRRVYQLTVGDKVGDFDIVVSAKAGDFSDKVTRKLHVKPKGFPTQIAYGGLLDQKSPASKEFTIPASVVANSMQGAVLVFPSPVANMTEAVEQLLQEPNGCFEQTSSTNYPLAMAEMYFKTHQGVDPKLVARADGLMAKGYQKLTAFECKDKGYEWFGGNAPGHEALTAYGLMEFKDMQASSPAMVDDQMMTRTRTWLLSRRDGNGGFKRNPQALDSFGGAPEATTNAYIVWALLRTGEKGLEKEIAAVKDAATKSADSYVNALAANVCELSGDKDGAATFMAKLAKKQEKTGAVSGATTSITRSGGEALAIETTSLAAQAWMQDAKFASNAQAGMTFLADTCKGGRFGSTQSTVLALQAVTAYDVAMAHPKAAGHVTLMVDKKPVGAAVSFTADQKEPLKFAEFASAMVPGAHTIALEMADGSQMPFSMAVKYNSMTPSSDAECKLNLTTTLTDAKVQEGAITEERVVVTNTSKEAAASPIAIIGIPGGLEVRHDQLKELVKAGTIAAYEVKGREVVLYWRQIKAGAKVELPLSLTAAVPGTYTAPASRAYEYYTDEFKVWKQGVAVTIVGK